jgi:agarase
MIRWLWIAATSIAVLSLSGAAAQVPEELDEYGGLKGVRRAATGYFRTTRAHGRWWLVDPSGMLFLSVGVDHVSLEPRGEPGTEALTYREAALAKHGSAAAWESATVQRLRSWGFNTLGVGSGPAVRERRMAHIVSLQCAAADGAADRGEFPDVFDPDYERAVRRHARQVCRPHVSDPWLLGYITDAHPLSALGVRSPTALLAQFLALADEAPGRRALLSSLETRYLNIREVNVAWGTSYESFEEIGRTPQVGSRIPQDDADAFQREVAREYMRIAHDAIRAVDEHHLILGPRFDEVVPPPVLEAMGEYVQAVCLDYRGADPPAQHLREIHRASGLPVILTAFGHASPEDPVVEPLEEGGPGETPSEVAEAYERFVRELVELPMVVGYHWHRYADAPVKEGIAVRPQRSGLVDIRDEPHRDLVEAATRVNKQIYTLAGGPSDAGGAAGPGESP